jgi:multiple sugar transport system ATP-binding protein
MWFRWVKGELLGMAEVALERVAKVYANGVHAVEDLTLTVADGELLVLVGPSGCGKTTTVRLIAGLETPTRGTIRLGGEVVNTLPAWRRDVGMVFQRPALYPHRTVRDNLAFSLALRQPGRLQRLLLGLVRPRRARQIRQHRAAITERVAETARLLGLTEVLHRSPRELSGGEQQRVALGRALVRRPGVLLLDEPLSNLDAGLRLELRRELHLLHRRFPATMVYVTHDPVEALTVGERVAVLREGRLQQVGRPQALYDRPQSRFVAGFLGWPPMNFLDGRLHRLEGKLVFTAPGWQVPLPAAKEPGDAWDGSPEVTLGIRPEHVRWQDEAGPDGTPMVVAMVEPFGSGVLVTFAAGGRFVTAVTAARGHGPVEEGRTVMVCLQADHAHLFDRTTGLALGTG